MNSQTKFISILAVLTLILFIGGGVIGFFYWQENKTDINDQEVIEVNKPEEVDNNEVVKTEETTTVVAEPEVVVKEDKEEITEEVLLQQLARSFTERYGSFSNQNDYENLKNLKIYMTEKMQKEVDEFILDNEKEDVESVEYYGITTKVLAVKKVSYKKGDNEAVYKVTAQRKESQGLTGENSVTTEDCEIEFKKVNGQWKVSSLTWK